MSRPDSTHVRLVDNKVVIPRPYAKTIHAENSTSVEFFPLSGMDLDGYYNLLPAAKAGPSTSPSYSAQKTHNPAPTSDLYTPAPTSSLLGTYEVALAPATEAGQV